MSGTEVMKKDQPGLPAIRRGDRQTKYLAQSVVLEEAGSAGLIRMAVYTVCLVILAFILWAAVTEVDEVSVTFGSVVPAGQVQTIQHLDGGVISQIMVGEGDLVAEGQVLVRLDPTGARADLEQLRSRRAALELQAERLRSFGNNRRPDFDIVDEQHTALARDQAEIHAMQVQSRESQRQVLRDQLEQRKAEISRIDEQEITVEKQLALLEDELQMRDSLYRRGLTTKVLYLDVQRQVNEARGELAQLMNERRRASKALAEVRSRLVELDDKLRNQALDQMGVVTGELAEVRQTIAKAEDRLRRTDVRAPVNGIVKGMTHHTVGGVLEAGGILMEIVPVDEEMLVETKINTRDVGHIRVGQPVSVKVTTYDYGRYGAITGELETVSATTFLDEEGEPYYKGVVSLDRNYVGFDPERNRVLPGMTVQADINTGKKTLLRYFLKPIYAGLDTAFRER